ncbi:MAG: hypothetical protein AAF742_09040, partial [Pseudomonadota bacterium]
MAFQSFGTSTTKQNSTRKSWMPRVAMGLLGSACLGGLAFGFLTEQAEFDEIGCFQGTSKADTGATVINIDTSIYEETTASQVSDIRNAVLGAYGKVPAGDRIALTTNAIDENGSVLKGGIVACRPPTSGAELKAITDLDVDEVTLERAAVKSQRSFDEKAWSTLKQASTAENRAPESPLFQ